MTTRNETNLHIGAETDDAVDGVLSLEDALKLLDSSVTDANTSLASGGETIKSLQEDLKDTNKAFEESDQKIRDVIKKFQEFGATVNQQERALSKIATTAARTGQPIALIARHAEELAIEFQDAEKALNSMDAALEFTARTGMRVEESVAAFAETMSGRGMAAFDALGGASKDVGEALAGIQDPALRARKAQEFLRREMKRSQSVTSKLGDRFKIFKAEAIAAAGGSKQLGAALKVLGVAGAAVSAIVGGTLVAGIKKYLAENTNAYRSQQRLKRSWDDFLYTLGGAVLGFGEATDGLDEVSSAVKDLTSWVKANSTTIQKWAKLAATALIKVVSALGQIALGFGAFVTALYEGAKTIFNRLVVGAVTAVEAIGDLLNKMGVLSDEASINLSNIRRDIEKTFNMEWDFSITEQLSGAIEELRNFEDGALDVIDNFGKRGGSKRGKGRRVRGGVASAKGKKPGSFEEAFGDGSKFFDKGHGALPELDPGKLRYMMEFSKQQKEITQDLELLSGTFAHVQKKLESQPDLTSLEATEDAIRELHLESIKMEGAATRLRDKARDLDSEAGFFDHSLRQQAESLRLQAEQLESNAEANERLAESYRKQATELDRLQKKQKKVEALNRTMKQAADTVSGAFQDMAISVPAAIGEALASADPGKIGEQLMSDMLGLITQLAPILFQIGIGMIGAETGNPALLIGAAVALSLLAGVIKGFSQRRNTSAGGSASRSNESLSRDLRQQGEESNINLTVNVGNERLDQRTLRVTRDGMLRNALPGGGAVQFGRG